MNDVSSVLGVYGGGTLVEALGQAWRLAPTTKGIQAKFEAWMKFQARKAILELKCLVDADEFAEEMNRLNESIATGRYAWGGPVMRQALSELPGQMHLAFLCLKEYHPDLAEERAAEVMLAAPEAVAAAVVEALRAGDPNRFPRPAASGAAGA